MAIDVERNKLLQEIIEELSLLRGGVVVAVSLLRDIKALLEGMKKK